MKYLIGCTLVYLLFLLAWPAVAWAQPVCRIDRFSGHKELAQRTVTDIAQDKKGFLWFSTWNGLNRFDGYTFKIYKTYPGDSCTLTSNRITQCIPNQVGHIWCRSHHNRIYLFDTDKENFTDVLLPFEERDRMSYPLVNIYTLPSSVTWITCTNGAFRIDEKKYQEDPHHPQAVTFFSAENGRLPHNHILSIRQDSEGDEWILTEKGCMVWGKKQITQHLVFTAACENNRKMYLRTQDELLGIYDFDSGTLRFREISDSHQHIRHLQSLGSDTVAICTDNGVMLYDGARKSFQKLPLPALFQSPGTFCKHIYKDLHGELWLFFNRKGVLRYHPATQECQHYHTPPQWMNRSEERSVPLIFEDPQGTLWTVPNQGTLCYYDRQHKELRPYYTNYSDAKSIFNPTILRFFIDDQKNLWYANSYELGKVSFFPNATQVQLLDYGMETRAFFVDKQNQLWVANKKGIIRIYHPDKTLKGYLAPDGSIRSEEVAFSHNIYCFLEDHSGHIWLGSRWEGLYLLKKKSDDGFSIEHYKHEPHNPYSLNNNSVFAIYEDSQQHIWIGTHGGGLNLLQVSENGEKRFLHAQNKLNYPQDRFNKIRILHEAKGCLLVGTTEGLISLPIRLGRPDSIPFYTNTRIPADVSSLSSNDVTSIYTDSRENTYVLSFTGGINRIVSDTLLTDRIRFRSYTKKDGLPSDLVLSMVEDDEHRLWVIAENNLIRFTPSENRFETFEQCLQDKQYFSEAAPVLHNGQLILGTESGFQCIYPSVFRNSRYVPAIVLTELKIQGKIQPLNLDNLACLTLNPDQRNLSVQFAALDFVSPEKIQYAYRLKGLEESWNDAGHSRSASYMNLPPGNYELEIRSTNSDGIWTDNIRRLPVEVIPTFGETYWATLLYILFALLSVSVVVYVVVYIYQLRHQISLEQQLTQIKLRFFTDISHELRTPLTLIASPVSEVLEHETLSESARKHLTLVHKNTGRMLHLINQILDFRKIENNKMGLLLEMTEAKVLITDVMNNFLLIAEEKHIDFRLVAEEEVRGWLDRDKVEKILFNLLSNAFKYTPDGKSITVKLQLAGPWMEIAVKDEGIGMDSATQKKLFQRFETLVHRHILQPSSGIGLSLVHELVGLHHGEITVNSEKGAGSEFILHLPVDKMAYTADSRAEFIAADATAVDEAVVPVLSDTGQDAGRDSEKDAGKEGITSILVVEDNQELRTFLYDILHHEYQVYLADNGKEGLEQALMHQPDMIISDIMMPVMDGLEMVKSVKENHETCHIPVILLSAKSSLHDRIAGIEQGIDDYVTKPFSSTYLRTRIRMLLQQRRELQQFLLHQWTEKQPEPAAGMVKIEPERPQIAPFDQLFMKQLMNFMEKEMDNSNLTVEDMAQAIGMGRSVFNQKLKSMVGLSPVEFIRDIRIKRARQLMESGEYNISTIAYMTGFNDPKYFSKCFKKAIGKTPTEFQKDHAASHEREGVV